MKVITKNTQVSTELTDRNFKASGGEGSVYIKGNTVYKIYHDGKPVIEERKLLELQKIQNSNVIVPKELLVNSKGQVIGYTMDKIDKGIELCQLFNKAFKDRHSISEKIILELIYNFKKLIEDVHFSNCIIVDLNEFNFLVDSKFSSIYAIDTDSYQTPSYKASALMESIRDRHSKHNEFTVYTDWFAFGIVTFQLWIGIHPYKGMNKKFKTLEERMKNNISVLNSEVHIPSICPSFDTIPSGLRKWYEDIFEKGVRTLPPKDFDNIKIQQVIKRVVATTSSKFDIVKLKEFSENIIKYWYFNGNEIVFTENKIHYKNVEFNTIPNTWFVLDNDSKNTPYSINLDFNGELFIKNLETNSYVNLNNVNYVAEQIMVHDNRVYFKQESSIFQIVNLNPLSIKLATNCTETSTQMFGGVVVQRMLQTVYVYWFPDKNRTLYSKVDELNNYQILNARMFNNILVVVGRDSFSNSGNYDKFVIKFASDGSKYTIRKIENVDNIDINAALTSNGICAHILNDGELEVFSAKYENTNITNISDPFIKTSITLFNSGSQIVFAEKNYLYSLKMKTK